MSERGSAVAMPFLDELATAGIKLRLAAGDGLQVTAPRGALTPRLREQIGEHKAELIAWLTRLADEDHASGTQLPRVRADVERLHEPFAPSDLQMSFLIGSRQGVEYYVRPHQYMEYDLPETDPKRLEQALNDELHYQRKNLVVVRDDLQLQTVRDPAPAQVQVYDLRGLSTAESLDRLAQIRASMARREPVHDRWPWVDVRVSLLPGGAGKLHFNNNNLFSDAPATLRFLSTVLRRYRDPGYAPAELEISYRDCVLALAELEQSPAGEKSRRYWLDRVAEWPAAPEVPLARGADPRMRSRLQRRELLFPAEVWSAIKERSAARGLTTTNVLSAVQAEVLAYWSGSRHFLLNNMITHRLPLHPQMDDVLGNFASLYPLETDWRHDESFEDRARRLQRQVMSDVEHVYFSGVKVLQALNQERRTPGKAVCPFAIGSALFVGEADRPVHSLLETPQTLIDCEFWDLRDGTLWVIWDVIEEMFPPGLIDAMHEGFRTVATRLADSDEAWLTPAFDMLPEQQRARREQANRPSGREPSGLLHEGLAEHAAADPDRDAVYSVRRGPQGGTSMSYGELRAHSVRLESLLRGHGVGRGDRVAVAVPKGWEQVAAVVAVLATGAAYVPIDPSWPEDRIRYLLRDTSAAAVVCGTEPSPALLASADVPVIGADATATAVERPPADGAGAGPEDLAYVIYTSGSTGHPKGAMLDHRGPVGTIAEVNRRFGVTSDDVFFALSSLCFDLSVYDVFGALRAGASLVMPEPGDTDPASWVEAVRTHGVTVWNSVPALMQLFAEEADAAGLQCPSLRLVLLSGDWIPVGLPDLVRRIAPQARVVSLGGATEASIWSICYPVDHPDPSWSSIPYGKPLDGQSWYVLDDCGRDAPDWTTGELYIGGRGVALGYLGDEERTEAAFVRHPRTGERLYRTGDLGRYLPSGDIEFLGRADFQVKIQGFRVEPGEVEHALLEYGGVAQAAVVARQSGGGKQLAAFVTAHDGEAAPDPDTLAAVLSENLPSYLLPSHITVLDRLPLTANGKLDRPALEAMGPERTQQSTEVTPPRTAFERMLVDIWESVLEVTPIGVHEDFFDLGGQSYTALRVLGRVARETGRRLALGALLEHRTVAELAEHLEHRNARWSPLVRLREGAPDSPSWYFVHPAGGNVLCYRPLAEAMGGPFAAFQAPGPGNGPGPLDDVPELAALHVAALRADRPHGPYLLGGWSSGAIVAVEMTRQLEEAGEQVAHLAVLDAPAPTVPREVDAERLLLWFLEDLDIGFSGERDSDAVLREFGKRAELPDEERLLRTLQRLPASLMSRAHTDPAELLAAFEVFRGVVVGCNRYEAAPVAADITVVRARQGSVTEFADHPSASAPDWGWPSVTSGKVDAVSLPGTHHTLLAEGQVDAVAHAITSRLHRSASARTAPTAD